MSIIRQLAHEPPLIVLTSFHHLFSSVYVLLVKVNQSLSHHSLSIFVVGCQEIVFQEHTELPCHKFPQANLIREYAHSFEGSAIFFRV